MLPPSTPIATPISIVVIGLLTLALLLLGLKRSLAGMTPLQRRVCLVMRALIQLLLLLAIADFRLRLPSDALGVIFAVDGSASISGEASRQAREFVAASLEHRRAGDEAGVIGFAKEVRTWQPPGTDLSQPWPELPDRSRTDFGKALAFANAIFPAEKTRRLVLLSDGNETEPRQATPDLEIFTVPLSNPEKPEVLVERVEVPAKVQTNEPFDLSARIRSVKATPANVKLYRNGFLVNDRPVELEPGLNEFKFQNLKVEGNFASYEVEVVAAEDALAENNRAQTTVTLRGQPRVLLVESDEAKTRPLKMALEAQSIAVEVRGVKGLPSRMEDLQGFDLLVLSDVPALSLSRDQMELYQLWVRDFGGGFLMLGGENSFGVGGYSNTPIEELLPVRMEHDNRQETPTVALMVILDRSGSMANQSGGQTKISLANQGAILAMNVLKDLDLFGLIAVDIRVHNVVPLGPLNQKANAEKRIRSITASGGGMYVYTSLLESFAQLREANAKVKHIILFCDAADAEEKTAGSTPDGIRGTGSALDLTGSLLSAGITTSVVALGSIRDKDAAFLKEVAIRGNGRYYLTSDALTLPQIFTTETLKVAQSSLVEEPFLATPARRSKMLDGINWAESPLLLGYNSTKLKPTADLHLASEQGEPLLATWRYGLGQAAAFTSDAKQRWASEWLGWQGFGKFWAQTVRALMRPGDLSQFETSTQETADSVTVFVDAVTLEGGFRNGLPVTVTCVDANGESSSQVAVQEEPGRYRATFPLPKTETALFSVRSEQLPNAEQVFGYSKPYPREFLAFTTDEARLRSLAEASGGRFNPKPEEVFERPGRPAVRSVELRQYFLSLALLLLPLDIWLRRRSWA